MIPQPVRRLCFSLGVAHREFKLGAPYQVLRTFSLHDPSLVWTESVATYNDTTPSGGGYRKHINFTTSLSNGAIVVLQMSYYLLAQDIEYPQINFTQHILANSFKFGMVLSVCVLHLSASVILICFLLELDVSASDYVGGGKNERLGTTLLSYDISP